MKCKPDGKNASLYPRIDRAWATVSRLERALYLSRPSVEGKLCKLGQNGGSFCMLCGMRAKDGRTDGMFREVHCRTAELIACINHRYVTVFEQTLFTLHDGEHLLDDLMFYSNNRHPTICFVSIFFSYRQRAIDTHCELSAIDAILQYTRTCCTPIYSRFRFSLHTKTWQMIYLPVTRQDGQRPSLSTSIWYLFAVRPIFPFYWVQD